MPPGNKLISMVYPLPGRPMPVNRINDCQNLSLFLHRFIPYDECTWTIPEKEKENVWRNLVTVGNKISPVASDFLKRQEYFARALVEVYGQENARQLTGRTSSRLVVGLGTSTPMETGLTLHRLYGVPYLPASAIKGVCRAWLLEKLADKYQVPRMLGVDIEAISDKDQKMTPLSIFEDLLLLKPEQTEEIKKACSRVPIGLSDAEIAKGNRKPFNNEMAAKEMLSDPGVVTFRSIFGTQNAKGAVRFFDAYPVEKSLGKGLFEMDIINVHYQKYYSTMLEDDPKNRMPPADYYNPVPVKFLTVKDKVVFRFIVTSNDKELLDEAVTVMKSALSEFGIGAKTALGYGEFEHLKEDA